MPYNVAPSTPPALNSSGQWISMAQIIAQLVGGGNPTPDSTPLTTNQTAALSAGQGPLTAAGANSWSAWANNSNNGVTNSAPTPGYNTNQFGVPLGNQQRNSY